MNRFVKYHKSVIEEMGSKVDYLVGFFHHSVTTMSVFMHVYRYPLEQKQVCEPSL